MQTMGGTLTTNLLQKLAIHPLALLLPQDLVRALFPCIRLQHILAQEFIDFSVLAAHELVIRKNLIEPVQSAVRHETQRGNHVSDGADGESAAREADENNGVAVDIVHADEGVELADVLGGLM